MSAQPKGEWREPTTEGGNGNLRRIKCVAERDKRAERLANRGVAGMRANATGCRQRRTTNPARGKSGVVNDAQLRTSEWSVPRDRRSMTAARRQEAQATGVLAPKSPTGVRYIKTLTPHRRRDLFGNSKTHSIFIDRTMNLEILNSSINYDPH
ncbi:hypothetical protein Nepgr_005663 [Nepenthes gracilis]|uniref:Uncharacterized protein n=1 Tax=Nepenthes gracilis TaxID=150966 RepID=A0AAD3XGK7_NEPGR|nr:hypothetical protein Nepgr_005663 [Nepenthes gracilis]